MAVFVFFSYLGNGVMPVKKRMFLYSMFFIAILLLAGCAQKNYDAFAKCLTENDAKMYGAYWCPHCNDQKKMFGDSFSKVKYIECSLPGGQGQVKECQDAAINGYPTWEFGDGSRLEGEVPLETLAAKSGCSL